MQHLRELLAINNSLIAQFLRSSLHGLEASLKNTQEQFPKDPWSRYMRCAAARTP
jgi:hypothetical protein